MVPVRRYCGLVDQDYKKNKTTVCAHLTNLYNSYLVRHGRPSSEVHNFFDLDKFCAKFDLSHSNYQSSSAANYSSSGPSTKQR